MKNILKILCFSVLIMSCAHIEDPRKNQGIHEDFKYEVGVFEVEFDTYINDIPISYKELEGNTIGVCASYSSYTSFKEIFIDPEFWSRATDLQRLALIFHELGHCYYGLGHNNGTMEVKDSVFELSCPVSLMHKSMHSQYCLKNYWNHYVQEMRESISK